ncbi:hypothetical protein [Pontibacter sp. CAU 1760]
MAGLQADSMNEELLRNLFTETIYVVAGESHTPTSLPSSAQAEEPIATAVNAPKAVPATKNLITDHKPIDTPVIPHAPAPVKKPAAPGKIDISGTNDKGIVVLVTITPEAFAQLPQLGFLQKILGAIGLKPTDVAYVNNVSGEIARFEELRQELQVSYIISFASRIDTDLPHDKFTLYHPVMLGDVPIVFSHALAKLEHDVEQKKLLWNALQQVFF